MQPLLSCVLGWTIMNLQEVNLENPAGVVLVKDFSSFCAI